MNSKDLARNIALAAAMIGVLPLAGLCALAEPAAAADFGQPFPGFADPAPLVEFASNWYVRGDLAYAQETFPNIAPFTFGSSPSALNTYSGGIGGGYKVNNWFRTDLILDYRSQIHAIGSAVTPCFTNVSNPPPGGNPVDATCVGHFDNEIRRWDLLANGYLDLGTWDGFTPYIGAGAGVTWARINQSVNFTLNGLPCQGRCGFRDAINPSVVTFADFDRSQSNMTYHFAWAAMAGVAIAMTDHAQLDVGYRFLDLGPITGISGVPGTSVTQKVVTQRVRANEVRVGVRYMID